ncbi:unnamed protein product [Urochloa humidicola]
MCIIFATAPSLQCLTPLFGSGAALALQLRREMSHPIVNLVFELQQASATDAGIVCDEKITVLVIAGGGREHAL